MFLPLAERMVEKMVKEEKIEAEAEVWTIFALNSCIPTQNFSPFFLFLYIHRLYLLLLLFFDRLKLERSMTASS